MKIALVGPLHPWRGGIAQYLGLLGEELAKQAEVRAVTFTRQYPGLLFPGKSQRDPAAPLPGFPATAMLDSINPFSWWSAARHLDAFGPGVVILKWWIPFFAPAFSNTVAPLRKRGTKVVLVCDNLVPHESRLGDRALTHMMLGHSDGYLVMSESVERDLDVLKPGAPRRRVHHPLYAQFDRGRYTRESARQKLGLSGDVALFFGYIRRYKGLDILLKAWPHVRARRPVTLVVAGEYYEDPAPYRTLAKRAGESVRMLDHYLPDDEVEAVFKAADVVVLPYRTATQSGVTHVAYALGVPVVTTDVGGLAETVRSGITGLIVPPHNPEALAFTLLSFFEQNMAPRLRAGVEELREQYSWSALAEHVLSLGDELAPDRGMVMETAPAHEASARSKAAHASGPERARIARTSRWIGVVAFLILVVTGGGRIVGSDEVTMLELSRAMLRGRIDVPQGATLPGPDGRSYTKNAAGQAVLAVPLVAAGQVAAAASGLPPGRSALALRFVASFFNALVASLLLAVFYRVARSLRVGAGPALAATFLLGFTTPLWVYAKSFMAEPLQGLGLLLALWGSLEERDHPRFGWKAGLGFLIATQVKVSMIPLGLVCLWPLWSKPGTRGFHLAGLYLVLTFALHGFYNFARFHDAFETGYGAQATAGAYTTPLLVGLYGLLLSSGKGALWFAPLLWLAPAGWNAMRRTGEGARRAAFATLAAAIIALLLYSRFEHWAGDGSWGPRYLVPLLPIAFLAVAFALQGATRARRAVAITLAVLGVVVQIGGVSIHFGAQMREAGDYPYQLPLDDPRFMSDSHFNPAFSPIGGHWRMLLRNAGEHLSGRAPRLSGGGDADARVGVGARDQQRLLHGLDYWWLYMSYAGLPAAPTLIALLVLLTALAWAVRRLRGALRLEAPEPWW